MPSGMQKTPHHTTKNFREGEDQRTRGTSRFLYARWASLRRGGFQVQGVLEFVEAMGEDAKTKDEPDGDHHREQQEAQAAQPRRAAHRLRLPADRWMRSLWILWSSNSREREKKARNRMQRGRVEVCMVYRIGLDVGLIRAARDTQMHILGMFYVNYTELDFVLFLLIFFNLEGEVWREE